MIIFNKERFKKILEFFKIKGFSKTFFILLIIVVIGTFVRAYHFQDWLQFGDDQIRDAYIINDVVTGKSAWPLAGPFMSFSGSGDHSEKNSFHIGPIYYYFQIISAKIFGNYPDKLAYPDVFFSILSIPLFYLFLRIYFSKNLSLGITGIYAISAYFVSYSRFAWNTNLIPFFVLLLLLSLYKFLEKNEKTPWLWVLSLGFAFGVGFQLHAIVLILFSAMIFLVFLVSIKRNYLVWKKWAVVFLIFIALNASQITSEIRTNFNNTKILFHLVFSDSKTPASLGVRADDVMSLSLPRLSMDLDCHMKANFFFLSSYGSEQCRYDFINLPSDILTTNIYFKNIESGIKFAILLVSLAFSVAGYFFLIYHVKKEEDKTKKYFLQLIIVYFAIGFLIMLPLNNKSINDLRYFTYGFFMPFIFLGFLIKFMSQKITRLKYMIPLVIIIFGLLIISNIKAIVAGANILLADKFTCSSLYRTTLGEIEPVIQYMIAHSNGQEKIYIKKDSSHRVMPDALVYLLSRRGVDLVKLEDENYQISSEKPTFYVSCKMPKTLLEDNILKIGRIYVSQLDNSNVSN